MLSQLDILRRCLCNIEYCCTYTVDIKIHVCVSWRMNCGQFVYSKWFDTDTLATNVCIVICYTHALPLLGAMLCIYYNYCCAVLTQLSMLYTPSRVVHN